MNIDDTMTTWRDIAPQLTARQRAMLDEWDTRPSHPDGDEGHRRGLVVVARQMAADNIAQETFASMPSPLGATSVDTWRADGDRPCIRRFTGPRRRLVAEGGRRLRLTFWVFSTPTARSSARSASAPMALIWAPRMWRGNWPTR